MSRYVTIALGVDKGDTATVHYNPPHTRDGRTYRASLHVHVTPQATVFGDPDAVIDLLADALTRCQAEMDARETKQEVAA